MKERESYILKSILEYLKYKKVFCWRNNVGSFPLSDSTGKQRYFRAGIPGMADIIAIHRGNAYAIEVKSERGKLSDLQINFLEAFVKAGGIAFVARSVEDVKVYFP